MNDETRAVIAGRHPHAHHGAVNTPIYRTSTILFETFEQFESRYDSSKVRFAYGRFGTPTSEALEEAMTELEGGAHCRLAPSGLAAITTALLAFVSAGDHVLVTDGAYPPCRRFCDGTLKKFGVETTYYDPAIGAGLAALVRPNTKVVYVESPGSGLFEMQDVPAIAKVAHQRGATVVMDNTWASPLYFKPFRHGVDVSIQAATKYIVGHSDAMLGTITCSQEAWPALSDTHRLLGQTAGPDEIYLAARGLRTMAVRLARHHQTGVALARYLAQRPEVERVFHPALENDPGHEIWKRDFTGASGLFSFKLRPRFAKAALVAMLDGLELFGYGASWGGFESLVYPFEPATFRKVRPEHEGWIVRVHAGLEDVADLIADLAAGFDRLNEF